MIRFHARALFVLALSCALSQAAQAQVLNDYARTPDQQAVARTFDSKADAAAPGSSLDQDNTRLLSGTSAQITDSVQSMLPTTAYGVGNVATSLASREESGLSSRLRALRNKNRLTPSRVTERQPLIKPLQESNDALYDLRATPRIPVPSSKQHSTVTNFKTVSPAVYIDPPSSKTAVERAYDESMRLSTIGAGAPNATTRGTNAPRVRNVPNMADRITTDMLKDAGDLAGQSQINASARSGYPRRTLVTSRDKDVRAASHYRGQPLSSLSAQASAPTPLTNLGTVSDPYRVAPPIIYGPNDPIPVAAPTVPVTTPATEPVPVVNAQPKEVFTYQKIDQSSSMTTPRIGPPSSRDSLRIKQPSTYAIISAKGGDAPSAYTPPRRPTDVGSYLWSDDGYEAPQSTPTTESRVEEPTPSIQLPTTQTPTYGTKAIPLTGATSLTDRRWGFFVTGETGFGDDKLQPDSAKTKSNTYGMTTGIDYRLKDDTYVGVALTYVRTNLKTGGLSELGANSVAVSLYGTSALDNDGYVDGYFSLGYHHLDSDRTVLAGAGTTREASATASGFQFSNKTEIGYDFAQGATTLTPYASWRMSYADFGDLSEKGAGNFNLNVDGTDQLSLIGGIGANVTHKLKLSDGGILEPAIRLGYNHEFGDATNAIRAEFVNMANSSFEVKSRKRSRDWITLSPSITAQLANDWSLGAQYEHDFFRDDVNENVFNLFANYKW